MNKHTRVWSLQEAKAKFSEVVKRAQTEGPQTVTVHGKAAVTISAAQGESETSKKFTGAELVKAFQACPFPEIFDDIDKLRIREPLVVRDIELE